MKKILVIGMLFCSGLVASGCGATGCDKLQSICNKCTDSTVKSNCDSTASGFKTLGPVGDADCQAIIDQKTYSSCGS